jgi:hypothetical protein
MHGSPYADWQSPHLPQACRSNASGLIHELISDQCHRHIGQRLQEGVSGVHTVIFHGHQQTMDTTARLHACRSLMATDSPMTPAPMTQTSCLPDAWADAAGVRARRADLWVSGNCGQELINQLVPVFIGLHLDVELSHCSHASHVGPACRGVDEICILDIPFCS